MRGRYVWGGGFPGGGRGGALPWTRGPELRQSRTDGRGYWPGLHVVNAKVLLPFLAVKDRPLIAFWGSPPSGVLVPRSKRLLPGLSTPLSTAMRTVACSHTQVYTWTGPNVFNVDVVPLSIVGLCFDTISDGISFFFKSDGCPKWT